MSQPNRRIAIALASVSILAVLSLSSCDAILETAVQGAKDGGAASTVAGSKATPLALAVGNKSAFMAPIGGTGTYYKFTPQAAGVYDLLVSEIAGNLSFLRVSRSGDASYRTGTTLDLVNQGNSAIVSLGYLPANTACYFAVVNPYDYINPAMNPTTTVSGNISIQSHVAANQGSVLAPVRLQLGATTGNQCSIGYGSLESVSYYVFTTGSASVYDILVSNVSPAAQSVTLYLYSDSGFQNSAITNYSYVSAGPRTNLTPNTTYYLKASQYSGAPGSVSFKLVIKEHVAANEGSQASPVTLALDTARASQVGGSGSSESYSYYKFTTGSSAAYDIVLGGLSSSLAFRVSQSSLFNSYYERVSATKCSNYTLSANTVYYLTVYNGTTASDVNFTMQIKAHVPENEGAIGAPVTLAQDTPHASQLGTGTAEKTSYYQCTVGSASSYDIVLSGLKTAPSFVFYPSPSFYSAVYLQPRWSTTLLSGIAMTPGSTFYLAVSNESVSSESFTMTIKPHIAANEGAAGTPKVLTLGSPRSCQVGAASGVDGYSYYTFTTNAKTMFDVVVIGAGAGLGMDLYNSLNLSGWREGRSGVATSWQGINLSASTQYYLRVSGGSQDSTFSMTVQEHVPTNDGSSASPMVLSVGAGGPNACKVGLSSLGEASSYYRFTVPGSGWTNTLKVSGAGGDLDYFLYNNSGYTGSLWTETTTGDANGTFSIAPGLSAGTYYLKVMNYAAGAVTYTLSLY